MSDQVLSIEVSSKSRGIELRRLAELKQGLVRFGSGVPLVLAFFALWEVLSRSGAIDQMFLPTFTETVKVLFNLTITGKLLLHIGASLQRSIIGFTLALAFAVPLGFLMGWYSKFEKYSDLFIQGLRNTSTFALMPIFLLFLGLGEASKIAIIFYGASWQILINTITGVKSVDPIYIKAAKSLGVTDKDLFKKVILPASIPSIISGARLGAKISLMVVIAAEMIGAKTGLGFFIQNAQFNFMVPEMFAGILALAIIGLAVNYLLVWAEKKLTNWKGSLDSAILG